MGCGSSADCKGALPLRRSSYLVSLGSNVSPTVLQGLPMTEPLTRWDDKSVRRWLLSLPAVLHVYANALTSPGGLVLHWTDEMLVEAGVANSFHRQQLIEYAMQLEAQIAKNRRHEDRRSRVGCSVTDSALHGRGCRLAIDPQQLSELGRAISGRVSTAVVRPPSAPRAKSFTDTSLSMTARELSAILHRHRAAEPLRQEVLPDKKEEASRERVDTVLSTGKTICGALKCVLPWPGDVAVDLLVSLLEQSEVAVLNGRNWRALNDRVLDLLQLLAANSALQAQEQTYCRLVETLVALLQRIEELYSEFAGRNWFVRLLAARGDAEVYQELWASLGTLVADVTLGISAQTSLQVQGLVGRMGRQPAYEDEAGAILSAIGGLGGVDAVLGDPARMAELAAKLSTSSQLTLKQLQQGAALLEAHMDEGVHSLIRQPQLRIFWRKCLAGQRQVEWPLFWSAFPDELRRVPVDEKVISTIKSLLSDGRRKIAFQRRLAAAGGGGTGRLSVAALRLAVPEHATLVECMTELTDLVDVADSCYSPGSSSSIKRSATSMWSSNRSSRNSPLSGAGGMWRSSAATGGDSSALVRFGSHVISYNGSPPQKVVPSAAPADLRASLKALSVAAATAAATTAAAHRASPCKSASPIRHHAPPAAPKKVPLADKKS